MANTNPLLDDIAGMMTGAMGAARAAGEEAKTAAQSRVRALERVEALEARIEKLEAAARPKKSKTEE